MTIDTEKSGIDRRTFLKRMAFAGAGLAAAVQAPTIGTQILLDPFLRRGLSIISGVRIDVQALAKSEAEKGEWLKNPLVSKGTIPEAPESGGALLMGLIADQLVDPKGPFVPAASMKVNVSPDQLLAFAGPRMAISIREARGGREMFGQNIMEANQDRQEGMLAIIVGGGNKDYTVNFQGLKPKTNWLGIYRPIQSPIQSWKELLEDRIAAMGKTPNCSNGNGCRFVSYSVIDVASHSFIKQSESLVI